MYLATVCTDGPFPADWSTWAGDNRVTYPRAPLITWLNTWFNAPCHFWPAAPGTRLPVTGERAPAILLISETYDAATPFAGALETRRRFPRSALIEGLGGSTHAASIGKVACTDDLVAAYLAEGALPERRAGDGSDRQCPPVPEPNPRHRPRAGSR
jgi:hypothetical protein